jgi:hypothetical protein
MGDCFRYRCFAGAGVYEILGVYWERSAKGGHVGIEEGSEQVILEGLRQQAQTKDQPIQRKLSFASLS